MIYSVIWKLKASRPIPSAKTSRSRGAETPLGTQGLSYIYIYREREREREIDIITMVIMMIIISLSLSIYIYIYIYLFICLCVYTCMYVCIYTYICTCIVRRLDITGQASHEPSMARFRNGV